MNSLRLSIAVGALILTLTIPAFAGEMHTPIAPPPPPAGDMETTCRVSATGFMDITGTEIGLSLMQDVLSLF